MPDAIPKDSRYVARLQLKRVNDLRAMSVGVMVSDRSLLISHRVLHRLAFSLSKCFIFMSSQELTLSTRDFLLSTHGLSQICSVLFRGWDNLPKVRLV